MEAKIKSHPSGEKYHALLTEYDHCFHVSEWHFFSFRRTKTILIQLVAIGMKGEFFKILNDFKVQY